MSLAAQFMRDTRAGEEESQLDSSGRLPLFAAADEIYKKQRNRRLASVMVLLVLPAMLAGTYFLGFWPAAIQPAQAMVTSADATAPLPLAGEAANPVIAEKPVQDEEVEKTLAEKIDDQPNKIVALTNDVVPSSDIPGGNEIIEPAVAPETLQPREEAVKKSPTQSAGARDHQLVNQANRLLATGQLAAAGELLAGQLNGEQSLPKSAAVYIALLIDQQAFAEAASLLSQYRQQQPYALGLFKLDVRLSMAQKRYAGAIAKLDQLPVPVEKDAAFLEFRAVALQAQGLYDDASAAYRRLLQFDSRQSRWWMGLAVSLDAGAHPEEARQAYLRALAIDDLRDDLSRYAYQRIAQL